MTSDSVAGYVVADSVAASMPLLSIWILQVSYAGCAENGKPL